MFTDHSLHNGKEKPEECVKRRTLPKVAVDHTPDCKTVPSSTKMLRTPASLGSENRAPAKNSEQHQERKRSQHKVQEPTSDDKARPATNFRRDLKVETSETPRRKSEFVAKSRPFVPSVRCAGDSSTTPIIGRRSAVDLCTPDWVVPVSLENTPVPRVNLKRPSEEAVSVNEDDLETEIQTSCITVAVRVRPFVQR
jgi:hypothetical protein